jgi:uracil-DNA glycosylase family 4
MATRADLYAVAVHLRRYMEQQRAIGCEGVVPAPQADRDALTQLTRTLEARTLAAVKAQLGDNMPRPRGAAPVAQTQAAPTSAAPQTGMPAPAQRAERVPDVRADGPSLWKQLGSRPVNIFKEPAAEPAPQAAEAKTEAPALAARELRRPEDRNRAPAAPLRAGQATVPAQAALAGVIEEEPMLEQAASALSGFDDSPDRVKKLDQMSRGEKLEFLRECLGDCERCGLASGRDKIVFGAGSPDAELVFVGEAPGFHEDRQGVPFVGKAGDLLDRMIVAMGLDRDKVYICNVIKCRPPDNRDPAPEEIQACSPFLYKQLEAIDPKVIVTLGRFAGNCLMGTQKTMGSMRGRWHDWRGVPVMPTFHPAYLLRNEQDKRLAWEDLQKVMKMMGLAKR